MADIHHRKKGFSLTIFFTIFTFAGVITLIFGVVFLIHVLRFHSVAVEVSGNIASISARRDSDGDTSYSVFVSYSYENQDYPHVPLRFYSSGMYEGQEIPLLVDPKNPGRVTSRAGDIFGCTMFLGIGTVFLLAGLIPLIWIGVRSQRDRRLLENGKMLTAAVERIDLNTSVTQNGRHPYIIICAYRDISQNVVYRFRSRNLTQEPDYAPGDSIHVYVDPRDYSRYVVHVEKTANPRVIDYT